MDSSMNTFISDQLHVAQQSRREKLRVQHCSPSRSDPRIDDYSNNLEVAQSGFNSDLVQVGDNMQSNANIMYHPTGCSSEMLNLFSSHCNTNSNGPRADQASGIVNSINMVTTLDGSLKTRVESSMENCGVWKNVCANSSADNGNTDSIGRYRKNNSLGIVNGLSAFDMIMKHQPIQSQYGDVNNFATQLHYQNALSDGVTTAVLGLQPNCNVGGSTCISWGGYGGDNENVPIAAYGYQSSDGECLLSGPSWNAEMSLLRSSSSSSSSSQMVVDSHLQGLSLSLCSYPAGSMMTGSQFRNSQHIPQSIPLHNVATVAFHDSKPCSPADFLRTSGVGQGAYLQESLGPSTDYHRETGPLGPFTGYTTILKSSRFLQPAQQLLDEYCGVIGKFASSSTRSSSVIDLGDSGDLATAVNSIVSDVVASGEYMGAAAATPQDSGENSKGSANSPRESRRPDYQARKAKLLYMLEEVSRRYKQYYQQMQMVVSAFESVTGLAGATPYISLALKAVSRHFSHLKSTISDQRRQIKTFLGEDFSLPHSGIRDKGDFNRKKLKYGDHSFQKHKSGGSSMGLFEPQQQIWRPQRGLPERAVSVLRAWLFEHFLHPYPMDTDKHMLATKTGLTRSQVSNWFINARVRLWKPMVEEVHMLETKFVAEKNINLGGDEDVSTNETNVHSNADRSLNQLDGSSKPSVNLECPATTGSLYEMTGDVCVAKEHNQEKHVQVDSHNMTSMNEGMFGISRYHQTAHDISGIGSISLTLGLKQSADQLYRFEGNQHQSYLQQQDRIRQHLGGHATDEYAG